MTFEHFRSLTLEENPQDMGGKKCVSYIQWWTA